MSPRFQGGNFAKNLELVEKVKAPAEAKNCTSSQLALAWVLAQEDIVPIPGTKHMTYLEDKVRALDVKLNAGVAGRRKGGFPGGPPPESDTPSP